jgi:predicted DNA-binding transcriptional regulator AlpA
MMDYLTGHLSPTSPSITPDRPLATAKPWLLCGISRAQWFKLYASGRTPLAIRLGSRRPVYLLAELEAWLSAGAPPRDQWERAKREGRP